jgi:nucleoside-diphosphate-sugar epimerase
LKVLLTGVTGFIGSHVARQLVETDDEIYGLVREHSHPWRIEEIESSLKLVQADLADDQALEGVLASLKPDVVLHLAWFAEPGVYVNSMQNLDVLTGSLRLAALAARSGCKYFMGVGTCFEYDLSYGYLSENTPVKPQSIYAGSKLAFKTVLDQLGRKTGIETAWVRLFYQYGAYEDKRRVVPAVITALLQQQTQKLTSGEQVRDYLHVEDVASAIAAIFRKRVTGEVNVGSGNPITIRDLTMKIGTLLGRTDLLEYGAIPNNPDDPRFVCANNRRLVEQTGWKPHYELEEGLRQTIHWWQKQIQGPEAGKFVFLADKPGKK